MMMSGSGESGSSERPNTAASQAIGIALVVGAQFLAAGGLTLQKHAHNTRGETPAVRVPLWWVGLFAMIFGEVGNFLAYAFIQAVVVAPLGCLNVVANAFLASFCLKEPFRPKRDLSGLALVVVGGVGVVLSVPAQDTVFSMEQLADVLLSPLPLVWFGLCAAGAAVLGFLSVRYPKIGGKHVLVIMSVVGMLGSITVLAVKGVAGALLLTAEGKATRQLASALFWILAVVGASSALLTLWFLNRAMALFASSSVVPALFVTFSTGAVVAGIVVYRELARIVFWRIILFVLSLAATVAGVVLVSSGRDSSHKPLPQNDDSAATPDADPAGLLESQPSPSPSLNVE